MRTIIRVAVMTLFSTLSVYAASLSTAQAQSTVDLIRTAGTFRAEGTQILFYPADGRNPVLVYNGSQRATAILVCRGAIFTAFDGGGIYLSPDGQNLGGGGRTGRVYPGNQVARKMVCDQGSGINGSNSVITTFSGGGVYKSPDGNNLGGGGRTIRLN
jgi:hypothetical protein